MQAQQHPSWHALPREEVLARLGAHVEGLSESEAAARLTKFGPNALPEAGRPSLALVVLRQFQSPLIYILLAACVVSLLLEHVNDALFILAVILIDAAVGATQEWQAETSAASLKRTLHILPTVVRAGRRKTVGIEELVPGDVVLVESGAAIPADLRLISTTDLRVDESLLTGEARPVTKHAEAQVDAAAVVGDRLNIAYAGAMVVAGRGAGVVCATGVHTQLGLIAKMLAGRGGQAPLILRMERFSNRIAIATVALVLLLGLGQYARGAGLADIFLFTIALAVSAIPEGLPMSITVALAVASARMGKRRVIVRRLPAVEALGSCTLIATDKTGTLTANRLTVKRLLLPDGVSVEIEGEGLELEGALLSANAPVGEQQTARALALARAAALTNEADIIGADGAVEARGDAVDVAFLVLAAKLGLDHDALQSEYTEFATLPYEPKRGYSASLNATHDGALVLVKGAPEHVLAMCGDVDQAWAGAEVLRMASEGYRVLAVAEGDAVDGRAALYEDRLRGLRFLGIAGLIDPLRSEAPAAVAEARAAGVDVRIITGDHPETALAVARQLDSTWTPDRAVTGAELATLEGGALSAAICDAAVFARVEPAQKYMIVQELQRQGHFVAVTGDGVNDAPALKAAHVGVAMGAGGTDVARAASDLIITDDNFASLVSGIEEGRGAYDNIRKIVWFLLSTAVAEIIIFVLALATGLPMPLTAVQILWLNLVTEGLQDVALGFEKREPDVMRRKPRRPNDPIFDRQMIEQCLIVGAYVGGVAFALFAWLNISQGHSVFDARNLTLLFMVSFHNFHAFNCRSETRSIVDVPFSANWLLVGSLFGAQGLHIAAMHLPVLRDVLDVAPVSIGDWVLVFVLGCTVLALGEAYKVLRARPNAPFAIQAPSNSA